MNKIVVEILPERKKPFRLVRSLLITLPNKKLMFIPKSFRYDGASVPRCLHWLVRVWGKDNLAFVVHDFLYEFHGYINKNKKFIGVTRANADLIMFSLAVRCGASPVRTFFMFWGVRIGGWLSWRKC